MQATKKDHALTLHQESSQELLVRLGSAIGPEKTNEFRARFKPRSSDPHPKDHVQRGVLYLREQMGDVGLQELAAYMEERGEAAVGRAGHQNASALSRLRAGYLAWANLLRSGLAPSRVAAVWAVQTAQDEQDRLPVDPILDVLDRRVAPVLPPSPVVATESIELGDDILAELDAQTALARQTRAAFAACEEKAEQAFDALCASDDHGRFMRLVPQVWEPVPGVKKVLLSTVSFLRNGHIYDRGCVVDEKTLDGHHPDLTRNPKTGMAVIRSHKGDTTVGRELRYVRVLNYREGMLFRIYVDERQGPGQVNPIESLAWYGVCERGTIKAIGAADYWKLTDRKTAD
jgi:hypothetical protein